MGLLKIIISLLKSSSKPSKKRKSTSPKAKTNLNPDDDLIQGMVFHPTLKLSTPVWILKKSGEVYSGKGTPPDYGGQAFGCWVYKLSPEFDIFEEGEMAASDAGSVDKDQYLDYAVGLLSIFESDGSINDKMELARHYSSKNKSLKNIEAKICKFYSEDNICNVMSRFISKEDCLTYFRDKEGFTHLVNGVNKKVKTAFDSSGITTINQLLSLTESDLLKLNGIGKVTAAKLYSEIQNLNDFFSK
ncbi:MULTISPECIES: helix-hairpin-helix domain-containing protein [Shewanella]|uniref:helix-hairpin-helix domain-containing protein n=1 Tax=Shewanella TaxID=22 RepID=UPI000B49EE59|nr:helix-hairpin-helix domain-containing protein [Shewanella sp. Shew256]